MLHQTHLKLLFDICSCKSVSTGSLHFSKKFLFPLSAKEHFARQLVVQHLTVTSVAK